MPRILSDDLCQMKIQDNLSGSEIVFIYRMPTSEERIAYSNNTINRKRNKVSFAYAKTRRIYGLKILTGIRDGDFLIKKDNKNVPLSSNRNSAHYDEKWKEHVAEYASDLVELLASQVFDIPAEALETDDLVIEDNQEPVEEEIEKD